MAEQQTTSFGIQFRNMLPWQPGMAILKFVQGMVEMVLRVAAAGMVLVALLSASEAISTINQDDEGVFERVEMLRETNELAREIDDLRKNTLGSAGWVVGISVFALLTQFVMIVVRFLNIDFINSNINIFLIVNVALSFFFGVGFLSGGIAMAVFAADYTDHIDTFDEIEGENEERADDFVDEFGAIRSSLISSTVFSCLAVLAFGFLGVWMFFFIVQKWNDKLKKVPGQNQQ